MKEILINNQNEMIKLACEIASDCNIKTIALYGTLGVGKSFFAKHFINSLQNEKDEILSPTFNIVCSYNTKRGEIFHLDLYRLKNVDELENIDFFSIINKHLTLIEWPEIAEKFLPKNYLAIRISTIKLSNCKQELADNSQRQIHLEYVTKF
jgi:tRNA threonylcarbamoyl adenosine modification protein YjeE